MSAITLGRYVPRQSFIHRMDPRSKVLCLIVFMVAIFIGFPTVEVTFIVGGSLALLIVALLLIAKVSIFDVFNSLKPLWIFVIILMIINVFAPPANATNVAFAIGKTNIYWEAIFQSLKIILRLILMICLTMILTATTKPLDLTYGLEWFMTPLKAIKFPAHEVAMTISIALRFIPTLLDETERIMKAQSSRGVDFKHGKLSSRVKALVSLIIPLFISSFQRSEELADSMEARGYDPKAKRTRYRLLKFSLNDLFALLLSAIVLTGVIILSKSEWSLQTSYFIPVYFISFGGIILLGAIIGFVDLIRRRAL